MASAQFSEAASEGAAPSVGFEVAFEQRDRVRAASQQDKAVHLLKDELVQVPRHGRRYDQRLLVPAEGDLAIIKVPLKPDRVPRLLPRPRRDRSAAAAAVGPLRIAQPRRASVNLS